MTKTPVEEEALDKDQFAYLLHAAATAAFYASAIHSARRYSLDMERAIDELRNHPLVLRNTELRLVADRLNKVFMQLTGFFESSTLIFRPTGPSLKKCDLQLLIHEVISYFQSTFKTGNIKFTSDVTCASSSKLDLTLMKVAFVHLVNNSIEAGAREIRVSARNVERDTGVTKQSFVEVAVSDDGIGIKRDSWDAAFEWFYSKKKDALGLGLPVVREILVAHKGAVKIVPSRFNKGTTILLTWPAN